MVKISELPLASAVTDDDIVPMVDETGTPGQTTKRANIAQVREHLNDTTDIGDLADVNTSGVVDGQNLAFDSGSGTWIPQNPGGGAAALDDLTDVNTSGLATGEILAYSGSQWVPTPFSDYDIDNLGDVNTAGVADGDVLTFNDATDTWEAMTPAEALEAAADTKRVLLNRTNYQSILNDTLTTITWTNEIEDDEGWHAANSSDVVVPAGVYLITLQWGWYDDSGTGANGTGTRFHHIEVDNGTDTRVIAAIAAEPTVSFDDCTGNMVVPYVATTTCTFRVKVYQDSGGTRAFGGAPRPLIAANLSSNTEFSVVQLNGLVVEGGGATNLDDLSDVTTTGVATGDFLQYNGSAWVDRTFVFDDISDVNLSGANNGDFLQRQSGVWVDRTLVFDDISDVDLTGAADGDFLKRVSGNWVDHDLVLDDATDVTISSPANGQVLTYNTGVWGNAAAPGGGSIAYSYDTRTSNVTINSTSYMDTTLEATVAATTGSIIQIGGDWLWYTEAVNARMDAVTRVGGSNINFCSGLTSSDNGIVAWFAGASALVSGGPAILYTVQSGDISGGNVTVRLVAKLDSASSRTFIGSADTPARFYVLRLT